MGVADTGIGQGGTRLSRWRWAIKPALLGAVMALGLAPTDLWLATLVASVWAIHVVAGLPDMRAAFRFGWVLGAAYFSVALFWIVEPFFVDAAAHAWMAPFALIGLAGGLGLFWAIAFGASAWFGKTRLVALVLLWTAVEYARSYILTGFPWAMPAQAWLDTPVMQWAAVGGQLGVMLLTTAFAASFAAMADRDNRMRAIAASVVLAAVLWGGGQGMVPALHRLDDRPIVRLVQPNAPQHERWDPAMMPVFFDRAVALSAAAPLDRPPEALVWPETSVPVLLDNADATLAYITAQAGDVPLIAGIQRQQDGRFYNSLVLTDETGAPERVYDKHHLVPFGEYMPLPGLFSRIGVAGLAARAEGAFSAGPGPHPLPVPGLGTALPLICYEAVFPHRLTQADFRADWILHVTNDAWFGTWSGPYQHLAQARIRAIEQGLPVLRAANTGVSAAIDGAGRIVGQLDLNRAGFLDVPLPPPLRVTPYSRTGDWPVGLLLVLGLSGCFLWTPRVSR